jgi:hypothetical protein
MRSIKSVVIAIALFLAATVGGGRASADVPGPHPAYLHALSDLRYARAYLAQWGPNEQLDQWQSEAIKHIDAAIAQIKRASIDDGKNLDDHPSIDTHLKREDRFRNAEKLLGKAHHDLDKAEDVPESRGLRDNALVEIDRAWTMTRNMDAYAH